MAIGNVIGSNNLNIFWILGVTATLNELPFSITLNTDLWFLAAVTTLFFVYSYSWRKNKVDRIEGALFIFLYVVYIAYVIWRG